MSAAVEFFRNTAGAWALLSALGVNAWRDARKDTRKQ